MPRSRKLLKKSILWARRYLQIAGVYPKPPPKPIPTSDELWLLYTQGCYRSVVKSGFEVKTGRDAIAMGVSLGACGKSAAGVKLIKAFVKRKLINRMQLLAAAKAISRFGHGAALKLIDDKKNDRAFHGLYISLLFAFKQDELAKTMLDHVLIERQSVKEPDLLLLQANAEVNPDAGLEKLNVFLARHKLAPVVRKDSNRPISASNLASCLSAGTIRGPLVSITMPAFNTGERIGPAIESLLGQTYRDIEVIVVDDCSSDNTVAVIRDLMSKDDRIRLVERQKNGGPYACRNMALELAQGEFVTCHDSDDWAHPEKIWRQVEPLLSMSVLKFTMSKWIRVEDDGRFSGVHVYPLTRTNPASPLFRRIATLEKIGYYENVRTGADSEYIARLKQVFGPRSWILLPQPLVFGAQRSDSLTGDSQTGTLKNGAMNPERLRYWERWRKRHREAWQKHLDLYVPYSD